VAESYYTVMSQTPDPRAEAKPPMGTRLNALYIRPLAAASTSDVWLSSDLEGTSSCRHRKMLAKRCNAQSLYGGPPRISITASCNRDFPHSAALSAFPTTDYPDPSSSHVLLVSSVSLCSASILRAVLYCVIPGTELLTVSHRLSASTGAQ
jgi:hypothetical protein